MFGLYRIAFKFFLLGLPKVQILGPPLRVARVIVWLVCGFRKQQWLHLPRHRLRWADCERGEKKLIFPV